MIPSLIDLCIDPRSIAAMKRRCKIAITVSKIELGVLSLLLFVLLVSLLLNPTTVLAQALRFQPQGANAVGQGNAFAAQADDASAIHYNPAGLTQVEGFQAAFGTALLGGSIKTKGPTGIDTRGDFGGSVVFPPPVIPISLPILDHSDSLAFLR